MALYAIIRRDGWRTGDDLRKRQHARPPSATTRCPTTSAGSAATSSREEAGSLGTVCIYEASSPEKIREHAERADLPVTEIIPIADTVVVRE